MNNTTIQIPFHASIHPDGCTPAISYASVHSLKHRQSLPPNPREYISTPSYGLVPANSKFTVTVSYCFIMLEKYPKF